MENTKEEMLNSLTEEINDIESSKNKTLGWTIALFSGLFVMVIGVVIIIMAQKGGLKPSYADTGFRVALGGAVLYWAVRFSNIFYRKYKKSKNNEPYQRKYSAKDFDNQEVSTKENIEEK